MENEAEHQHELDSMRIRQIALGRRASMRLGSYCLIGAMACLVATIELICRAVRASGFSFAANTLAAVLCAWGTIKFLRKARRLRREANAVALAEPSVPPDFSTLSDGSHIVKNLEEM
jgi:hypothetical protein